MAKGQLTRVGAEIDAYHIALSDLLGSHQVSDGLDKQPLDGAFQVPGAISRVCTFVEQILLACVRYPQLRCTAWYRMMEPLLNAVQFDLHDLPELDVTEQPEHHNFVQAIEELGTELPPRSVNGAGCDLLVELLAVIGN